MTQLLCGYEEQQVGSEHLGLLPVHTDMEEGRSYRVSPT